MGIINKQKSRALDNLERKDVEFILNKLRTATYTGNEFEHFYRVYSTLTDYLKTFKT
jgi:hypothetical protein